MKEESKRFRAKITGTFWVFSVVPYCMIEYSQDAQPGLSSINIHVWIAYLLRLAPALDQKNMRLMLNLSRYRVIDHHGLVRSKTEVPRSF